MVFPITKILACKCVCEDDCSFKITAQKNELVVFVNVVSHENYLNYDIPGYKGKMPNAMVVEVIKKYKGNELRKRIKIWGDDGAKCRPYISRFKVGEYYLMAPSLMRLSDGSESDDTLDYYLFICNMDYLKVDIHNKKALGEYTKDLSEIGMQEFEESF